MNGTEDKFPIKLYMGDVTKINTNTGNVEQVIGSTLEIHELVKMTYDELVQRNFTASEKSHIFDYEGRPMIFLNWCDDYLFEFGTLTYYADCIATLSNFYYTPMTKYQEVISATIFDEKVKICITKTDRPILQKIIKYVKDRDLKQSE